MTRPRVIYVVAHDRHGVMGRDGGLPWHLPEDLRHFRRLTIGKPVIMGRKTFASIGKPLQRRRNIVLTRSMPSFEGVELAHSIGEIFAMTQAHAEIAVIGGAQLFSAFASYVDTAFVTRVEADVKGDVFYRAPERRCTCEVLGRAPADDRNAYAMTFLRYDYEEPPFTKTP